MCGRFTRYATLAAYRDMFGLASSAELPSSYNIAPTQTVLAARAHDGTLTGDALRWGLIPSWSKDKKTSFINARADTVATKPAFRAASKRRRCLILADGYYEWRTEGKTKTPFYFHMRDTRPMAFAGIWETWSGADTPIESCAIITTDANEVARTVHDRMPVILRGTDAAAWLEPGVEEARLIDLLRPCAADAMVFRQVGPNVNSVKNNDASLIEPVAP